MQTIKISKILWNNLILELKIRGKGIRESGAFLLSGTEQTIIDDFICFDDCDPNCLKGSYIEFSSTGYKKLWDYCMLQNKHVVADVHTHPGSRTIQSITDKEHPMIVLPGHVALIVPYYASSNQSSFNKVSAYEYLGDKKWKKFLLRKKMMQYGNN